MSPGSVVVLNEVYVGPHSEIRAAGICVRCECVGYCAADCEIAPWNQDVPDHLFRPRSRYSYLRRMVKWIGGRLLIDKSEIRWVYLKRAR